MAPVLRHVLLTEIALDDHTFIVTYRPEMHALRRSVAHVGVLTPLHLRQPSDQALLQAQSASWPVSRLDTQACRLWYIAPPNSLNSKRFC